MSGGWEVAIVTAQAIAEILRAGAGRNLPGQLLLFPA
jgi:hypothetical protein